MYRYTKLKNWRLLLSLNMMILFYSGFVSSQNVKIDDGTIGMMNIASCNFTTMPTNPSLYVEWNMEAEGEPKRLIFTHDLGGNTHTPSAYCQGRCSGRTLTRDNNGGEVQLNITELSGFFHGNIECVIGLVAGTISSGNVKSNAYSNYDDVIPLIDYGNVSVVGSVTGCMPQCNLTFTSTTGVNHTCDDTNHVRNTNGTYNQICNAPTNQNWLFLTVKVPTLYGSRPKKSPDLATTTGSPTATPLPQLYLCGNGTNSLPVGPSSAVGGISFVFCICLGLGTYLSHLGGNLAKKQNSKNSRRGKLPVWLTIRAFLISLFATVVTCGASIGMIAGLCGALRDEWMMWVFPLITFMVLLILIYTAIFALLKEIKAKDIKITQNEQAGSVEIEWPLSELKGILYMVESYSEAKKTWEEIECTQDTKLEFQAEGACKGLLRIISIHPMGFYQASEKKTLTKRISSGSNRVSPTTSREDIVTGTTEL